jgi:polyisoprenoid-binding protein YceI
MADTTHRSTPTRMVDGVEGPAPGDWVIDPGHAEVAFVGRHFMLTKVRGRFRGVEGIVHVAEDPDETTVEVTIDMASVDSGDDTRDEHLRSADLFDVANHPVATFQGTARDWVGTSGRLAGDLTIKGVTRPVVLDVEYVGYATDPWGGQRAVFSAAGRLNREDWGIGWNMVLDSGGLLVSKEIRLELEIETVYQAT